MNYEPLIKGRMRRFQQDFNYVACEKEDELFEKFVNYTLLYQHQPEAFNSDSELLESICVGGGGDAALDGVAIKVQGVFVRSISDVDEILKNVRGNISIEFVFIQSKNKDSFINKDVLAFTDGVKAFFEKNSTMPFNDEVSFWREIKDYLYTEDVLVRWSENPSVRCYFVTMGEWNGNPQHEDSIRRFKQDLTNDFSEVHFHFFGGSDIKEALDRNENQLTAQLPYVDTIAFPGVTDVDGSCIILCQANEYIQMLDTKEGIIRKSLFNDNVRDFQGENNINIEIANTIEHSPEKFMLLNNGITIVCKEYKLINRLVRIENPQIVNGCQTSNILFLMSKRLNKDLSNITLVVKVISTTNPEIANAIVRSTNRQNIVFDEAFEATKIFHKDFESFMNEYDCGIQPKLYYERRSRQYADIPTINSHQIIDLRELTQYSVAVLLEKPHLSHRHQGWLIREFSDVLFNEKDSRLPYYAVVYAFSALENKIKDSSFPKRLKTYKGHLLMIYFKLLGWKSLNLEQHKMVDKQALAILDNIKNGDAYNDTINQVIAVFKNAENIWTTKLHKSKYGIKDNPYFTSLILNNINGNKAILKDDIKHTGLIEFVDIERIIPYGYIRDDKDNTRVYFSYAKNKHLMVTAISNKRCEFVTAIDSFGRIYAKDIKIL